MKTCTNCGKQNNDTSIYCSNCGKQLPKEQQDNEITLSKFSSSEEILKAIQKECLTRFSQTNRTYKDITLDTMNPDYYLPHTPSTKDEFHVWDWLSKLEVSAQSFDKTNHLIKDAFIALFKISSEDISIEEFQKASLIFFKDTIIELEKANSEALKSLISAIHTLRLAISIFFDKDN